ncbi:MAG: HI0074 family nucleotidyltransferase substrate-binding subunit [Dehalococcoidia bacterium]|nr:HI0074 family nucleotidyltransferase substrate-binding subunit [Dehalococcoidia bacterium]
MAAVEQGLQEYEQHPSLLTIRDGVIQRFEIAMDLAWKLTQRALRETYGVAEEDLRTKKDIFREAATKGLIADAERWMDHQEARNQTSHIYDAEIAQQVFAHIPGFVPDARELLVRLKDAA